MNLQIHVLCLDKEYTIEHGSWYRDVMDGSFKWKNHLSESLFEKQKSWENNFSGAVRIIYTFIIKMKICLAV